MRIYEPAENRAETVRCLPRRTKEMHLQQAPKSHSETFLISFVDYNFKKCICITIVSDWFWESRQVWIVGYCQYHDRLKEELISHKKMRNGNTISSIISFFRGGGIYFSDNE